MRCGGWQTAFSSARPRISTSRRRTRRWRSARHRTHPSCPGQRGQSGGEIPPAGKRVCAALEPGGVQDRREERAQPRGAEEAGRDGRRHPARFSRIWLPAGAIPGFGVTFSITARECRVKVKAGLEERLESFLTPNVADFTSSRGRSKKSEGFFGWGGHLRAAFAPPEISPLSLQSFDLPSGEAKYRGAMPSACNPKYRCSIVSARFQRAFEPSLAVENKLRRRHTVRGRGAASALRRNLRSRHGQKRIVMLQPPPYGSALQSLEAGSERPPDRSRRAPAPPRGGTSCGERRDRLPKFGEARLDRDRRRDASHAAMDRDRNHGHQCTP